MVAVECALLGGAPVLSFVRRRRRFTAPAMIGRTILYVGFVGYVVVFGA